MGATRCPAVSAEWSPDGRSLLVATTAPRLRVDNSFKVIAYHGEQVCGRGGGVECGGRVECGWECGWECWWECGVRVGVDVGVDVGGGHLAFIRCG